MKFFSLNFELIETIKGSSFFVQLILLYLLFMSVRSWSIITKHFSEIKFQKNTMQKALRAASFRNEHASNNIKNMTKKFTKPSVAVGIMLSCLSYGAPNKNFSNLNQIKTSLRALASKQIGTHESKIESLASIASIAPFVGLLGTVIGIMNSFSAISASSSVSIKTIAPSISEALFTTAVGIFVAIPSNIFYNKFLSDIALMRNDAELLISDMINLSIRDENNY